MKITITADGRKLAATTNGQPLTSGSVGIEAAFVLSADYDGLAVTAVFSAGETQIDVVLTNPSCIVPWEVLQEAKNTLYVGVVGKNGSGEIVIPTVWGRVGVIECGTVAEGLDPQDPTPDIAAQILQQARAALEEAEETKEAAAQSAEKAAGSATDAAAAKTAAEAAQAAAAGSANDAAGSASDAAAAKTAAEAAQAAAAGSANDAAGSATDAAAAKTAAEAAQAAAAGSANDAAGSATDAAAAKTAAEAAQAAAETARSAAEASASSAAGSASTAEQQAQAAGSARTAAEAAQEAAEVAKNYAQTFTGAPRAAGSSAQMTDISLIYVYTGTASGTLTNGHWYYWDGSAWADGGVYNSTAVETDTTLTVSGAPADAKATGDAVGDLKSAVDAIDVEIYGACALEWSDGLYGANGYTTTAKWMHTNILQPGTYTINTPDNFRYQVFKYISDAAGEAIETNVHEDKTYTVSEPVVISAGLRSGYTLTNDDKSTIRNNFVVTDDNKSLAKSIERHEEEITSLRSDLTNSNLRYYGEEISTAQSAFIYFAGGLAIADGLMVNRINAKIIHPSVATSDDTRGVGLSIAGKDKNGNAVSLLSSRNIFPQNHSAAHKMTVIFDLFSMPYKVVGKVDYYVDNVYSRSYDVNLASQVELDGIYTVGAFFNTDSTTEKTYIKTGILYQGGSVIA